MQGEFKRTQDGTVDNNKTAFLDSIMKDEDGLVTPDVSSELQGILDKVNIANEEVINLTLVELTHQEKAPKPFRYQNSDKITSRHL